MAKKYRKCWVFRTPWGYTVASEVKYGVIENHPKGKYYRSKKPAKKLLKKMQKEGRCPIR